MKYIRLFFSVICYIYIYLCWIPIIQMIMKIYFTDFFGVSPEVMESYGAFNISLINDLPLFIPKEIRFARNHA